jgi:peptidoglycan/LPS O-acetylase OafA/YrhL
METRVMRHRPVARAESPARLRGHIASLDGLRGFAAILVVMSHLPNVGFGAAVPSQSGVIGVMIFFVLSGFLMGHLYLFKPFDVPAVFHYIIARVARVLPLFYAVVIGSFILSHVFGKDYPYYLDAAATVKHLAMVGSAYVFWSIPPEVEFYFIFVLIWLLFATRYATRLVPLLVISLALLIAAHPVFPGITVFNKFHIFLVGVGCAVLRNSLDVNFVSKRAALCAQVLGLLLIALVITNVLPVTETRFAFDWEQGRVYDSLPMALAFGGFIFAFTIETRFTLTVFGNRYARKLGAYSFSVYLLHEPVMIGVRAMLVPAGAPYQFQLVIALTASIVAAAASFHLFEMPMQTLVRSISVRVGRFTVGRMRSLNIEPAWLLRKEATQGNGVS